MHDRPDYFGNLSPIHHILSRINGNIRRVLVAFEATQDGIAAVPVKWRAPSLTLHDRNQIQAQNPAWRGGEDLPDLPPGQVEVARLTNLDTVHAEVTSLRASRIGDGPAILLEMVDEYGTAFCLPDPERPGPLTEAEVHAAFGDASPCPCEVDGRWRITSFFYPALMCPEVAQALHADPARLRGARKRRRSG